MKQHTRNWTGAPRRDSQAGYTLVALIVVMTILALFAVAAAPSIKQQGQREREKEAVFRGEEVAEAIRRYYESHGAQGVQSLPTSMDQLLEGVTVGTRKVQILRREAAVDPLSSTGEWRVIGPTSQDLIQFVQAVTVYNGGTPPATRGSLQRFVPQLMNVLNTGSTGTATGGEDDAGNTTGPFIGVASRSQRNSVIAYYGIDRHDQWVFTPLFR